MQAMKSIIKWKTIASSPNAPIFDINTKVTTYSRYKEQNKKCNQNQIYFLRKERKVQKS